MTVPLNNQIVQQLIAERAEQYVREMFDRLPNQINDKRRQIAVKKIIRVMKSWNRSPPLEGDAWMDAR